jgi:periplasmic protein TonB
MKTRSILVASYEIKRPYQRNLAIGFGFSSFIPLMAAAIIVAYFQPAPLELRLTTVDGPIQPPRIFYDPPPQRISDIERPVNKPEIKGGIPTPVPDKDAPINSDMPTIEEISHYAPDIPITDLGGGIIIDTDKVFESAFPAIDSFIPVDEQPVQINIVQPQYPDLARRAGIEKKLIVKALIDRDGTVKKAIVVSPDPSDVGFEAAAIEAAMRSTWRPAISNGQPLAVWITYVVAFKLK